MKAIALFPATKELKVVDIKEPGAIQADEVKLKIIEVGICGTDREEAAGQRGDPPKGEKMLVLGHEMLGKVVEVGSSVKKVQPGDFAVVTVRRGCGKCIACNHDRYDMCYTGEYKERGIKELNGFQTEYVVDHEKFVVRVPPNISSFAVLTEPTTVIEKAISEAAKIQRNRIPEIQEENWLNGKCVLVAGLGPIGLLAAMVLRLRGAQVIGLDIVDQDSARPKLLKEMGGKYVDGRQVKTENIPQQFGQIDMIVEATGIAKLDFALLDALGINGILVLTGIPGGSRCITVDGAELMHQLVMKNQVVVGSVNASFAHFEQAVHDLALAETKWGGLIEKLITSRIPYNQMENALKSHPENEIKTTIQWDGSK